MVTALDPSADHFSSLYIPKEATPVDPQMTSGDEAMSALKREMHANEAQLTKARLQQQIIEDFVGNSLVIEPNQVEQLLKQTNLTIHELLQKLIPIAKTRALPPISHYHVGAAGLGKSEQDLPRASTSNTSAIP